MNNLFVYAQKLKRNWGQSGRGEFLRLNALPDTVYDTITTTASYICQAAVAIIDLADSDKNVIKSHCGIPFKGLDQELEFLYQWSNNPNLGVFVENGMENSGLSKKELLNMNDLYCLATLPILDSEGNPLGMLTIADTEQRLLTFKQETALLSYLKYIQSVFNGPVRK